MRLFVRTVVQKMEGRRIVDTETAGEGHEAVRKSAPIGVLKRGPTGTDLKSQRGPVIESAALVERGGQARETVVEGRKNEMGGNDGNDPQGTMDVSRIGTKRRILDVALLSLRLHLSRLIAVVIIIGVAVEARGGRTEEIDGIAVAWDERGIAVTMHLHTET